MPQTTRARNGFVRPRLPWDRRATYLGRQPGTPDMQIVCPACDAHYEVPDERLAPGKRVKCARCGEGWTPIAPAPAAKPEPAVARTIFDAEPTTQPPAGFFAATPLTTPQARPRAGAGLVWAGWAATLVILIACVFAAHQFRPQIEHAWPPSARLYGLFSHSG